MEFEIKLSNSFYAKITIFIKTEYLFVVIINTHNPHPTCSHSSPSASIRYKLIYIFNSNLGYFPTKFPVVLALCVQVLSIGLTCLKIFQTNGSSKFYWHVWIQSARNLHSYKYSFNKKSGVNKQAPDGLVMPVKSVSFLYQTITSSIHQYII